MKGSNNGAEMRDSLNSQTLTSRDGSYRSLNSSTVSSTQQQSIQHDSGTMLTDDLNQPMPPQRHKSRNRASKPRALTESYAQASSSPGPKATLDTPHDSLHDEVNESHDEVDSSLPLVPADEQIDAPLRVVNNRQETPPSPLFCRQNYVPNDDIEQPGAYHVRGMFGYDESSTVLQDDDSTPYQQGERGRTEDEILSASLVDPQADQVRICDVLKRVDLIDERLGRLIPSNGAAIPTAHEAVPISEECKAHQDGRQHDNSCCVVCGIDFSRRTNRVVALTFVTLAIAVVVLGMMSVAMPRSPRSVATSASSSWPSLAPPTFAPSQLPTSPSTSISRSPSHENSLSPKLPHNQTETPPPISTSSPPSATNIPSPLPSAPVATSAPSPTASPTQRLTPTPTQMPLSIVTPRPFPNPTPTPTPGPTKAPTPAPTSTPVLITPPPNPIPSNHPTFFSAAPSTVVTGTAFSRQQLLWRHPQPHPRCCPSL